MKNYMLCISLTSKLHITNHFYALSEINTVYNHNSKNILGAYTCLFITHLAKKWGEICTSPFLDFLQVSWDYFNKLFFDYLATECLFVIRVQSGKNYKKWKTPSSMILLFYRLSLQQNDTLVMSLCMQLHFRKERGKYHYDESDAKRHQPLDEKTDTPKFLCLRLKHTSICMSIFYPRADVVLPFSTSLFFGNR